ncbi:DNA polymerase epsilon subunit B [Frankliniella fusca]|uniref:DNA polymerase epsilon subunit B n=1 Tax=Frankliniella fusca TaxID=407009 RepID=A0AAE1L8S1_9NEOP|nr:DNA polymerase epsilon subunit B [Frankliniella fusca]
MQVKDFIRSQENPPDDNADALKSLSEVEKILVKSLQRVVIRGKKGRGVPVLLTEDMQISVQALIDLRLELDVPESNEYLFPALHAEDGHHRADLVLRKMANACGASDPSSLTGTRLRKHVGTLMTLLNLRDHELDAVADFMGHDIGVHRQYYRLSSDTMQLAKVSKILLNMEKGNVDSMRGLNLDEVTVDDEVDDAEEEEVEDPFQDEAPRAPVSSKRPRRDSSSSSSDSSIKKTAKKKPTEKIDD